MVRGHACCVGQAVGTPQAVTCLNHGPAWLAADGTLKLWDLRKFKAPVRQAGDLPSNYGSTQVRAGCVFPSDVQTLHCTFSNPALSLLCRVVLQCCYSPDEKFVLTGTSAEGKDSNGSVVVLSADSLERVGEIGVEGSAVAVQVGVMQWPANCPRPPCSC